MTEEEWRSVPGYEGLYEVSSLGRVLRLPIKIQRPNGVLARSKSGLLKPTPRKSGHLYVSIFKNGKRKTIGVHRLVCLAFHGPAPEDKPMALHFNDAPADNRAENLRWGDGFDNQRDSVRNGTHVGVKKTHCPKNHPLSGDNLYIYPRGSRTCRECMRESTREWRRKGRAD